MTYSLAKSVCLWASLRFLSTISISATIVYVHCFGFNLFVSFCLIFVLSDLILDTFLRFSFVCHPLLLCLFLLVLLAYSIEFVHLILSLDVVQFFHLSFSWFLLLCYSYVEELECSWFIWLKTHWFGNFVGDYLSFEGRAEGGTVRKDIWVATREHSSSST